MKKRNQLKRNQAASYIKELKKQNNSKWASSASRLVNSMKITRARVSAKAGLKK
jgi:hypothetical protein